MKLPTQLQNEFRSLILFDGVCNLCNKSAMFVIRRDPIGRFTFASLQSRTGQRILGELQIDRSEMTTMIYIDQDEYYVRSTAALCVLRDLGGVWGVLYAGIIIPERVRDWAYRLIASRRYQWFGKSDVCRVPHPKVASRFLD